MGKPKKWGSTNSRFWGLHVFFLVFYLVALRHWVIPGDYLWTEEGGRLSWSMRLRGKSCTYEYRRASSETWQEMDISRYRFLQRLSLSNPLFLLQALQAEQCQGENRRVYARIQCFITGHPKGELINSDFNLCSESYSLFFHNEWINPFPNDKDS